MFLFLSAQDISFVEVGLLNDGGHLFAFKKFACPPEKYLSAISDFLDEHKISPNDLERIIVVVGPGSFTASRITVTIANALAFAKNIPVLGIENPERQSGEELIKKTGVDWIKLPATGFVNPVYDRPPNITIKK